MNSFTNINVVVGSVTLLGGLFIVKQVLQSSKRSTLPPGPFRWPILGSALAVPQVHPWLTFSKWAKEFGNMVYVEVIGQPIIILNSVKVAKDLLDKRSLIYSNRPRLIMAELSGYDRPFVLQQYGEEFRKQRRMVAQGFNQAIVPEYYSIQETEARKLARNILDDPSTLKDEIQLRIGTIIIRATYGRYLTSRSDPFLTAPLTAMDNFSQASRPGAWLVDLIPQLKYVPKWMPGAGFRRTAEKWRQIVWDASWDPYLWSKANLESGAALTPNMCATVLSAQDGDISSEEEAHLVWSTSTVMGGGLDTNMSTILTFFLAMVLYPEVQVKARAEIDSVIGPSRLPSINDMGSLPFIRSIMTESFRWIPAMPLGIPHSLSQADVYEGVHLPKDSILIPNVWHMFHDPDVYPRPMDFNPDRYQNSDAEMQKVTDLLFGFGRRACPGFYFAQGTMFAMIATVLATCEITPALDKDGKAIIPDVAYTSGTIIFPLAFECNVKCRSPEALALLLQTPLASE